MSAQPRSVTTRRLRGVLGGALVTWAAGSAALLLAARSSATDLSARGLAGLEGALTTAASMLGVVLLSWLAGAFVASVLELTGSDSPGVAPRVASEAVAPRPACPAPGRARCPRDYGPRVVRRVAALVLGLSVAAVTAGPAGAAIAATSSTSAPTATAAEPVAVVSAGDGRAAQEAATWTPDRPAASISRTAAPDIALVTAAPRLGAAIIEEVAVRGGDSLWSIAARHLGPDARADDVARAWPLWWQANRGVIGEDPDLIFPGQVLHAPSAKPE